MRKQPTANTLQMYIECKKWKAHFCIGKFNLAAFAQHCPALAEGLGEMSMFENVTEPRDPEERGDGRKGGEWRQEVKQRTERRKERWRLKKENVHEGRADTRARKGRL